MTHAANIAIPGGYLIERPGGRVCPFRVRDFRSAVALVKAHPYGTFSHYEASRRWRILRAIDGVCVTE